MSDEERDYFTKFGMFIKILLIAYHWPITLQPWSTRVNCFFATHNYLFCVKAADARKEFNQQVIEYRATGSYQPSKHFMRLKNSSVWIRKDRPSPLEQEISSYETIQFPKRPPELDEEYKEREIRSRLKRKLKLKGLLNEDGKTWKDGIDFEAELEKEMKKQVKKNKVQPQE